MPKLKVHVISLALSIALVGCAHNKPQSQYEQFSKIPERTEWQILYLKDFNPNPTGLIPASGQTKSLRDYSVIAVKNDSHQLFYLERIPFCEGAGGSISPTGKVEYLVLQGACTELIFYNGVKQEVLSFVSLLEQNLIGSLIKDGTVWHLDGEYLKLKDSKNIILGEFLRIE